MEMPKDLADQVKKAIGFSTNPSNCSTCAFRKVVSIMGPNYLACGLFDRHEKRDQLGYFIVADSDVCTRYNPGRKT